MVVGVPASGRRFAGAARVPEHLADGHGFRQSGHPGERDDELRMTLPLGEEPGRSVEDRDVARRAELAGEPRADLRVGQPRRVARELPQGADRRRAVAVRDPRVRRAVVDVDAERAAGVVAEPLLPQLPQDRVPRLPGGQEVGVEREAEPRARSLPASRSSSSTPPSGKGRPTSSS